MSSISRRHISVVKTVVEQCERCDDVNIKIAGFVTSTKPKNEWVVGFEEIRRQGLGVVFIPKYGPVPDQGGV